VAPDGLSARGKGQSKEGQDERAHTGMDDGALTFAPLYSYFSPLAPAIRRRTHVFFPRDEDHDSTDAPQNLNPESTT
jgi:hypothetical protein